MKLLRVARKKMYDIKEMMYVSSFKKTFYKNSLLVAIVVFVTVMCFLPSIMKRNETILYLRQKHPTDLKYILFWSQEMGKENVNILNARLLNRESRYDQGQSMFIKQKCPHYNCYITYNKSFLRSDEYYDAIVFDVHDLMTNHNAINLTRSSDQKYIFKSLEPAEFSALCYNFYDNFFNWTWTYKLDSDIPHPFIQVLNTKNETIGPSENMQWISKMKRVNRSYDVVKTKKKAVAWIVGKCKLKSKHRDFFDELKKELKNYNYTVDTFGPCGDKKCPNGQIANCYKVMERDYFFQLVLEESTEEDYVTERLANALSMVIIPIVTGNVEYNRFMTPGTYLHAKFFDMNKLGAIMHYLVENRKVYEYFFEWRQYYRYTTKPRDNVCDLCATLNNVSLMEENQIHSEFRKWWNPDYKKICKRRHYYNKLSLDGVL